VTFFALSANGWLQTALLFAVLLACMKPLGSYMAAVYSGERTFLHPFFHRIENGFYRISGIVPDHEMDWKEYAKALVAFSIVNFCGLFALLRLQGKLPLNPNGFPSLPPDLAFNATASFFTNTGWQSHVPETTISVLSQIAGFTVQNFISPAIALAVMAALVRGFARVRTEKIGNFWTDIARGILYILLPLALILALLLVSQGVVQTFRTSVEYSAIDRSFQTAGKQTMAMGPAASFTAIKQLSSTGGGYFNANSAHPFENPTPLSNFLELLAILLIPAAQIYMFGRMARSAGQGWALFIAMATIFLPLFLLAAAQEQGGNPLFAPLKVDQYAGMLQTGGNMEGKEIRFGILNSSLWTSATTATSNGSVNSAIDSMTPLGSMVPLMLMQFDEAIFGGPGSGLTSMLVFVVLTVFLTGLMSGHTPEYLGKKIQTFDMKMAALAMLAPHLLSLGGAAIAMSLEAGREAATNPGAQGFSEILYAFTSAANANGSAMAGLYSNTPFYNTALGVTMLLGRFLIIFPVLALAGSLAGKTRSPFLSQVNLVTASPLFSLILAATVVILSVLAFLPTLVLGPVAEYFHLMAAG